MTMKNTDETATPAEGVGETFHLCRPHIHTQEEDLPSSSLAQRGYISVSAGTRRVRFAVVGDVHGQFNLVGRKLQQIHDNNHLDFILQVGDLECHRHEQDLESMAAPSQHRHLGDFATTVLRHDNKNSNNSSTLSYWPCPFYFIGGNHECFGWLDNEMHYKEATSSKNTKQQPRQVQAFLQVAPNMFYLGRAGYLPLRFYTENDDSSNQLFNLNILGMLNLAYLSGIAPAGQGGYTDRRPAMTAANLHKESNGSWIGFNIYDINVLLQDEADHGIDHTSPIAIANSDDYDYSMTMTSEEETVVYVQDLATRRQQVTFLLAQLLGVNMTLEHIQQVADVSSPVDITLSRVDVQFLTRFLIPHHPLHTSMEQTMTKRQGAVEQLPTSLSGIVTFVLKQHSKDTLDKLMFQKECLHRKRAVDILLTHDWPANVATEQELYGASAKDKRVRPVGNAVCRQVLDRLKPTLHCCGHMHVGYCQEIQHSTPAGELLPGLTTKLCCLGKVGESGAAAFAVFEYDLETGVIEAISF